MQTPTKIFKTRTIEDISKENKELLQKIKNNSLELHTKKMNEKAEKEKEKMEKLLNSSRKTFAFHIISSEPIDFEKTKLFVENLWKKMGKNIQKFVYINNFIYIKSKQNTNIKEASLGIGENCKLEQIDPKHLIQNL